MTLRASTLLRLADAAYSLSTSTFVIHARKESSHYSLSALELADLIDRHHECTTALYYILKEELWDEDDDED